MLDVLGFDLITHHDDDPQVDDSFNDEDESIDDYKLIQTAFTICHVRLSVKIIKFSQLN